MKPELKELLKEWFKEDGSREYLKTMYSLREEALKEKSEETAPNGIFRVYKNSYYRQGNGNGIYGISYFKNRRSHIGIHIRGDGNLCNYARTSSRSLTYTSWEKLVVGLERNNLKIDLTNFRNKLIEEKIIGKPIKIV